jgi:hypothetical protein
MGTRNAYRLSVDPKIIMCTGVMLALIQIKTALKQEDRKDMMN